ncbi:MAG: hybrid sensor histidine kinase/response regulator [Bacteroidetes bacterium]|nr:hybrid sensor histidine kinase/response regulator [Bacteroidota bacterium]
MEKLSVMVVDDEPGIRSGVKRILSAHTVSFPFMDDDYGFDCREASTGEEALEMIEADPPDILLLDNKLPGITGMEVLEIIQQQKMDIIVAMITSYASLEVAAKATDDGARDFIPKPFTPSELKASVDLITKQFFLKRITRTMKEEGKKIRYQFLSVLSHELKSPLNALEGYLEMMKDRELGGSLEDYDQVLERSLQRVEGMRSLIMDLLDFTKIRLERREEKIENINLEESADLAISTIKPLAIQRNISVSSEVGENLFFEADPSDLDIMLNNLLSNAVKYNRDGGSVELLLLKDRGKMEIIVRDTGFGMNEQEVSQLFKEFVRIKNKRTKGITGSGLGLSIVHKIAELYGGHIQVKSEPDRGSEFRVILPVQ